MKYAGSTVAFLDILGFTEMTALGDEEAVRRIRLIDDQLRHVEGEVREHQEWGQSFSAKLFSDCVCLVSEATPNGADAVVYSCAILELMFALEGVFLRGGIATGRHFQNDRMIFSEGLVEAYKLESKAAVYPRVLVSPAVISNLDACRDYLREDDDGCVFVDYLEWCCKQHSAKGQHPYDTHKAQTLRQLELNRDRPGIRNKYEWLARYHNRKIRELIAMPANAVGSIDTSMLINVR